jgi:hypothetical protein
MDKARDKGIWQLDYQAVIADIDNCGAKNLRITLIELALKKLKLLHPDRFDLGIGCSAFGR